MTRKARRTFLGVALVVTSLVGCGGPSEGIHAVSGKIELQSGSADWLAGHMLEVAQKANPSVRGFGVLDEQGHFRLESLHDGKVRDGIPAGEYQARLVLNLEGDGQDRRMAIDKKYFHFSTSGLTLEVPGQQSVTWTISTR